MIKTFACKQTEQLHTVGTVARPFGAFARPGKRKLMMRHAAVKLRDLRSPPGNRLEKLSGDRAGQYSIRINDQWRICFRWDKGDVHDVAICDYH